MAKFLIIAVIMTLACRLITGRWPWQWMRTQSTRSIALTKARDLLGVAPNATQRDIIEAHRRLVALVHPDRGGTNDQMHEANAARDLLLNALPKNQ